MTIASERKSVENIHDFAGLACACRAPRRGFLGKLAALGAAALLPGELTAQSAQKAIAKPYRIADLRQVADRVASGLDNE